ncbi:type III secretion system YopJ family effector RipJ [Ralstonia pseudosolanacearum]|uniref:type III secretion system YopJ family effector RipJ n=1 Tax=Ralstonia pseudosolanacearum TaxID=1310165 RepID=UPI003CE7598C
MPRSNMARGSAVPSAMPTGELARGRCSYRGFFTMRSNFNNSVNRQHSVPDTSANTTTPATIGQASTDRVPTARGLSQAEPGVRARDEQFAVLPRRRSRDENALPSIDQPAAQRPRVSLPPHAAKAASQPRVDSGASPSSAPKPELSMDLARKRYPALTHYLERLEAAYGSDTALHPIEDIDHMETIIKGLNLADPMLNLHLDKMQADDSPEQIRESVLAKTLEAELRLEPRQRASNGWREIIHDTGHSIAMGVQCSRSSNDVSILVIDSGSADREVTKKWRGVVQAIAPDIQAKLGPSASPVRLRVQFFAINTQRSQEGSGIFALSAAKKMASDRAIRGLQDLTLQMMATGQYKEGVYRADERKAAQFLPPSLYKHATSKRVLDAYVAERARGALFRVVDRPDGKVNKKGQTLVERYAAHEIQRRERPVDYNVPLLCTYSNSYEAKRIDLIWTALAALTHPRQA